MVSIIPARPSAFERKETESPAPQSEPSKEPESIPESIPEATPIESAPVEDEVETIPVQVNSVNAEPGGNGNGMDGEGGPETPSENAGPEEPDEPSDYSDEEPTHVPPNDSVELPDLDPRGDPDNVRFFVKGSQYDNEFPRPYEVVLGKYENPYEFRMGTLYPKLISKVKKLLRPMGKESIALKTFVYRWQCQNMLVRAKGGFERIELNKKYVTTDEHKTIKKTRLPNEPTGLVNSIRPKQEVG